MMAEIYSNRIYRLQELGEILFGICPFYKCEKDELRKLFDSHGYENLWDYRLDELSEVSEGTKVILCDTSFVSDETGEIEEEHRWFELDDELAGRLFTYELNKKKEREAV